MALLTVDPEKCARDGICVAECPAKIVELADKESFPSLIEGGEEYCINCGHCVVVCPRGALSLETMAPEECLPVQRALLPSAEQVDHFLKSRRSIRSYKKQPVNEELLRTLIDVARYAPTGHNSQTVHWLVIDGFDQVKALAALVVDWMRTAIDANEEIAQWLHFDRVVAAWERGTDRILRGAPHLLIAHGPEDFPPTQTSCTIALTHLELSAYAHGLGACWAGYFHRAAVVYEPMQKALALPKGHVTCGAMMIGNPKYKFHRIPLRNNARIAWRRG